MRANDLIEYSGNVNELEITVYFFHFKKNLSFIYFFSLEGKPEFMKLPFRIINIRGINITVAFAFLALPYSKLHLSCESECRSGCRFRSEAWLLQLHWQLQPQDSCNANSKCKIWRETAMFNDASSHVSFIFQNARGPGDVKVQYKSAFTVCHSF